MIAALVLAAGGSSRLGRPKPLVEIGGRSLIERTVDAAEACGGPIFVVLGAAAEQVAENLRGSRLHLVLNPRWVEGMAASIRRGIEDVERHRPKVDAVLLLVSDQPRISDAVVRRICERFDGSPGCVVASAYAGTVGVPALFGREWFTRLRELGGDRGAKGLLLEARERLIRVDWPEGAFDVDRPGDAGLDGASRL